MIVRIKNKKRHKTGWGNTKNTAPRNTLLVLKFYLVRKSLSLFIPETLTRVFFGNIFAGNNAAKFPNDLLFRIREAIYYSVKNVQTQFIDLFLCSIFKKIGFLYVLFIDFTGNSLQLNTFNMDQGRQQLFKNCQKLCNRFYL